MFVYWFLSLLVPSAGDQLLSRDKWTVSQSTTGHGGVAERAIDGNQHTNYRERSCTSTYEPRAGVGNWWLLDLGERARITAIKIWNRSDCCSERINGAKVWVDKAEVGQLWNSQSMNFMYNVETDVVGRYVRVTQDFHILTLCEVEVYGNYIGESGEGPNYFHHPVIVSQNKPTSLSRGHTSHGAVNGGHFGNNGHDGNCAGAEVDDIFQSWWQVDLEEEFKVTLVVLYPRRGRGVETLQGAKVYVDDSLCGVYGRSNESRDLFAIKCPTGGLVGRKVKVVRENNIIELCEAEVFGVKPTENVEPLTDDEEEEEHPTAWL